MLVSFQKLKIMNIMQKLRDKVNSPFYFLLIVLLAIFAAEATAMLFLSFFKGLSFLSFQHTMLDSSVLVILIIPVLYMFLYFPMKMLISERIGRRIFRLHRCLL